MRPGGDSRSPPLRFREFSADVLARELRTDTPSLAYLAEDLLVAGRYNVPLLLTGETGTGKTMLARLIHQNSVRKKRPFVTVPCGAVSSSWLQSEFFGHVQGAFTGAITQRIGRFAAAGYGTVLLDEIDVLPLARQASLLRVIETGEFEPVGSEQTQFCRARIAATSNVDLEEAIRKGTFRQDLYYRLSGLSFHLPPLRERVQDIPPLAASFVGQFCVKCGKPRVRLHDDSLRTLQGFAWPGNIRQLENVVHEAVLRCQGAQILPEHLPPLVVAKNAEAPRATTNLTSSTHPSVYRKTSRADGKDRPLAFRSAPRDVDRFPVSAISRAITASRRSDLLTFSRHSQPLLRAEG